MSKQRLKAMVTTPKTLINLKVSGKDLKEIRSNALKYAGGNVSAWVRHASVNYVPDDEDLEKSSRKV